MSTNEGGVLILVLVISHIPHLFLRFWIIIDFGRKTAKNLLKNFKIMVLWMQIYMDLTESWVVLIYNHENLPKQPQKMAGKLQNLVFWGEKHPQNLIIQNHRFMVRNVG